MDGVTSSALLARFLRALGARPRVFIPDRFIDGYGLNGRRIRELVAEGTRLLLTVDCGTAHAAEVALAQEAGCDVIVCDHHSVPEDRARPFALLNPAREDCAFPYARMAAVGVAFYLAMATRAHLRERGAFGAHRPEPDLRGLLELVALGSVADVMPLRGVNRPLVVHGLRRMNRAPSPGIAALARAARIDDRPVVASDLGFRLGPRINAAGRMAHAGSGYELLTTADPERAAELAQRLNRGNQGRRDTEALVQTEAMEQGRAQVEAGARGLVLHGEGWHLGVLGIVAARVREALHRPTFVLGTHPEDGGLKGSGRSTPARARIRDEDLEPRLLVDAELRLEEIDLALWESLERLAPFGAGNRRPVFATRGVRVRSWRTIGDGSHIELRLEANDGVIRAVGFGMAHLSPHLAGPVDLAYQIVENRWKERRSVELQLKDLRPAAPAGRP